MGKETKNSYSLAKVVLLDHMAACKEIYVKFRACFRKKILTDRTETSIDGILG